MYKGTIKEINDDEFTNCHSVGFRDLYEIDDILEKKGITQLSEKLEFVKKNFYGQYYMYYTLKELDDIILKNYHEIPEEITFTKDAVDGILRSYLFAISLLTPNLPEHAHNYLISKSSSFFNQLLKDYKNNLNLK